MKDISEKYQDMRLSDIYIHTITSKTKNRRFHSVMIIPTNPLFPYLSIGEDFLDTVLDTAVRTRLSDSGVISR